MTPAELIGEVTASYLERRLQDHAPFGTARFILDRLSEEQLAAVARSIIKRPALQEKLEIKLPKRLLNEAGLPESVLTDRRATHWRHARCDKPALLIANLGDDEEQSLRELTPVGYRQLIERTDVWVDVASDGLSLQRQQRKWWQQALAGLMELRIMSLIHVARYVLRTRRHVEKDGDPLLTALGRALPALQFPKDTRVFLGIPERKRGHRVQWKKRFDTIQRKQSPYLSKLDSSGRFESRDELQSSFDKAKEHISEPCHEAIERFIEASSGWNEQAAALAEHEWNDVKPFFDGLRKAKKFDFRKTTVTFYEEREPELLSDDERDYLKRLAESRRTTESEDDEEFFKRHRRELANETRLVSEWEKFVFKAPVEEEDFLIGLIKALEALIPRAAIGKRHFVIRTDWSTKNDWSKLNSDAGEYFERRYRGLPAVFGKHVRWEVSELFDYSKLLDEWRRRPKGNKRNTSKARRALRIKFVLELRIEGADALELRKRLIWKFNHKSVKSQLAGDWGRLVKHPLCYCRASADLLKSKGAASSVDLQDRGTLGAAYGQSRGTFVRPYTEGHDIALAWQRNWENVQKQKFLSPETAQDVQKRFETFRDLYSSAVQGFIENGLACNEIETQAAAFGELVDAVRKGAADDSTRDLLLRPLMHIGVASLANDEDCAIVTPWHPLRMAAMARKARHVARIVKRFSTDETIRFGDRQLYFREMAEDLRHPFYPEIVLGWDERIARPLSVLGISGDYSLHGPPVPAERKHDGADEDPGEGADQVQDLVRRFLSLYPHEKADLSVALYNANSARLPLEVVKKFVTLYRDDPELRCHVIILHRDRNRHNFIYRSIVEMSAGDSDVFQASEASQDYMARLRIEAGTHRSGTNGTVHGKPIDILFSQDVISGHAAVRWRPVSSHPADPESLVPNRWSRKRPTLRGDLKSAVYLCCPEQTTAGWAWMSAIAAFVASGQPAHDSQRLLPVWELDFKDNRIATIVKETHGLANWVANYDRLLDRSHLEGQDVKTIRWKQDSTQGRNLVVSTTAPMRTLESMLVDRLERLGLDLDRVELLDLARQFIDNANMISGAIVLRAAKHGRHASELIGLELSRFLVQSEMEANRPVGWYLLDDYAAWLGQREGQIADILALSPRYEDKEPVLDIVITEAKYVGGSEKFHSDKSKRQLRQTLVRVRDALNDSPAGIDRDLFLARFSDLLVSRVRLMPEEPLSLSTWRRKVRNGECRIDLRGYSHVFVSGPAGTNGTDSRTPISGIGNAYQEVYHPVRVRDLVMDFYLKVPPFTTQTERPNPPAHIPSGETRSDASRSVRTISLTAKPPAALCEKQPPQSIEVRHRTTTSNMLPPVDTDGRSAFDRIVDTLKPMAAGDDTAEEGKWLAATSAKMKSALRQFNLSARLESERLTPNAALLKFRGSRDLTIKQVQSRRSELLTTYGLKVLSVEPEPGIISIAVERPEREVVLLERMWSTWKPDLNGGNQDLLIGVREADGEPPIPVPGKQARAPHADRRCNGQW